MKRVFYAGLVVGCLVALVFSVKPAWGDVVTQYVSKSLFYNTIRMNGPRTDPKLELQKALYRGGVSYWTPGGASQVQSFGATATTNGTISTPTQTTTNLFTSIFRWKQATSAAANNKSVTQVSNVGIAIRGNASGLGGFTFKARCGIDLYSQSVRAMIGVNPASASGLAATSNPSVQVDALYFGFDSNSAADGGTLATWNICTNDNAGAPTATCTPISGTTFPIDSQANMYDFTLYCPSNTARCDWDIKRLSTGDHTNGSISSELPTNTTPLTPIVWIANGGDSVANSLDCAFVYFDSDEPNTPPY